MQILSYIFHPEHVTDWLLEKEWHQAKNLGPMGMSLRMSYGLPASYYSFVIQLSRPLVLN